METNDSENNCNKECPPCLVEGTQVILRREIKSIEDVKVGNGVYTNQGKYGRVVGVNERVYSGDLISINTSLMRNNLLGTSDYPVFCTVFSTEGKVISNKIKPMNKLSRKDWLMFPREKDKSCLESFSLVELLNKNMIGSKSAEIYRKRVIVTYKDYVYNHMLEELTKYPFLMSGSNILGDRVAVSDDLIRLIGILFNLSIIKRDDGTYAFLFRKPHEDLAYEVSELISKCFSIAHKIITFSSMNMVTVQSEVFVEIINCLKLAMERKANFDIFSQFSARQAGLFLDAFFSVGNKNDRGRVKYTGPIYRINFITKMLLNIGVVPHVVKSKDGRRGRIQIRWSQGCLLKQGRVHEKKLQHFIVTDKYVYFKVLRNKVVSVTDFPTCNLEISGNCSYVANFISCSKNKMNHK